VLTGAAQHVEHDVGGLGVDVTGQLRHPAEGLASDDEVPHSRQGSQSSTHASACSGGANARNRSTASLVDRGVDARPLERAVRL
jgi:hypothetical protein